MQYYYAYVYARIVQAASAGFSAMRSSFCRALSHTAENRALALQHAG